MDKERRGMLLGGPPSVQYLRGFDDKGDRFPDIDLDRFPQYIDLVPAFTAELVDLYLYVASGDVYSDSTQEKMKNFAQRMDEYFGAKGFADLIRSESAHQALVERSKVIFYNPTRDLVSVSPIEVGTYGSGKVSTLQLINMGMLPMVEIHTHPEPGLFSPYDYQRMLWVVRRDHRLCRASIVLNPDHQLLAFATTETPRFSDWKEASDYLEEVNEEINFSLSNAWQTSLKKEKYTFSSLLGDLPDDYEQATKLLMDHFVRSIQEHNVVADANAQAVNMRTVNLARELWVALYFSTDYEHFTKWSA